MVVTCRLDPTNEEYKLCVDSFLPFKRFQEKGHVEDEVFERIGFPMDQYFDSTKVSFDSIWK